MYIYKSVLFILFLIFTEKILINPVIYLQFSLNFSLLRARVRKTRTICIQFYGLFYVFRLTLMCTKSVHERINELTLKKKKTKLNSYF